MGLRLGSQVIPTVRLYKSGAKYPTGVIEINSETPAQYNVEITSSNSTGSGDYSRIIYEDTRYYTTGDKFTVKPGDVINIWVASQRTDAAYLYLNGEQIAGGALVSGQIRYNYIAPNNMNVFIRINDGPTSYVYITEEELDEKTYDVSDYAFANVTGISDTEDYFTQYATDTLVSYSNSNITSLPAYAFYGRNNLEEVNFPNCTSIGGSAFQSCTSLILANFPVCTSISSYAFRGCSSLTSANFPACTSIGNGAFSNCSSLTSISFPVCANIGSYTFYDCLSLTTVSFPVCTSIGNYAFRYCYNLLSLYLLGSNLCSLGGTTTFSSTPISTYTTSTGGIYGSIYVPASLLASYQTATNWVYYSSRFVGV